MDAVFIILTGTLVAWLCGILGVFIVLRKLSMLGDAISHAVLPGIVIAYLISGDRSSPLLFMGAALFGVAVTVLIEFLNKKAAMQSDASVGTSFTLFFSIGIILVSLLASRVDIDADCVLHGEIGLVPFDRIVTNGIDFGPRQLWIIGVSFIVVTIVLIWAYKGLYLTSFNSEFAASLGVGIAGWHYLLMSSVSLATVVSFEAVGAILVVGFLVIPPASAWLWSRRLNEMIVLTLIMGLVSSVCGYYLAVLLDSSIAATMCVVALIQFVISFLINPRHGVLKRWIYKAHLSPHKPI
jgi:manganese/zinc/iron transport system permease protein